MPSTMPGTWGCCTQTLKGNNDLQDACYVLGMVRPSPCATKFQYMVIRPTHESRNTPDEPAILEVGLPDTHRYDEDRIAESVHRTLAVCQAGSKDFVCITSPQAHRNRQIPQCCAHCMDTPLSTDRSVISPEPQRLEMGKLRLEFWGLSI